MAFAYFRIGGGKMAEQMLSEICRSINNYFVVSQESGSFEIYGGTIALSGRYLKGQYIALQGSILNDGIYQLDGGIDGVWTLPGAQDEAFTGTVYGLVIPKDFLELVKSIEAFQEKQGTPSNNVSESFGAYSESKATDSQGQVATWVNVFRTKLNPYRKMFSDVRI